MMKMKMKKRLLGVAIAASLGVVAVPFGAQAATLSTGDVLTITPGVITVHTIPNSTNTYTTVSGSWFSMGGAGAAKTVLAPGVQGLVFGTTQNMGGWDSYSGAPKAGDVSNINAPWYFYNNTGKNYTTSAVTGSVSLGLDFSGWTVSWNTINPINMGAGAWGTGYTSGVANVTWDGTIGDSYKLDYHATVPAGSASGFGGVQYALHFAGNVTAGPAATAATDWGPAPAPVPIPAAAWLFGSGLIGLVGVARRRKGSNKG
jgi:hypothetical protein